jgi:hypothetical protein
VVELSGATRREALEAKDAMGLVTVEVDIEHGRLTARQPQLLPETGVGLMTILPLIQNDAPLRGRVNLPLVHCAPGTLVNPTAEDLDASLWD